MGTPSLEHAWVRQQAIMRRLRLLGFGLLALIEVTGALSSPRPGLSGDRLGILLGLAGIAIGLIGGQRAAPGAMAAQGASSAILVASSVALVWLQPNGPFRLGRGDGGWRPRPAEELACLSGEDAHRVPAALVARRPPEATAGVGQAVGLPSGSYTRRWQRPRPGVGSGVLHHEADATPNL